MLTCNITGKYKIKNEFKVLFTHSCQSWRYTN